MMSIKKITILMVVCILSFLSCKKDTKTITTDSTEKTAKQSDGLTLLKGEFVYHKDAAVLQTHGDIYGVFVNDKMLELEKIAEKHKKSPTDMVMVEIRGKITDKKDEKILWENKVEIVEILNVSPIDSKENNIIKLGSE